MTRRTETEYERRERIRLEAAEDRAANFPRVVKRVADALRRLADEVEREGELWEPTDFDRAPLRHVKAASRVLHTVTWGVANLNVEAVVEAAAEADALAHVPTPKEESDRA